MPSNFLSSDMFLCRGTGESRFSETVRPFFIPSTKPRISKTEVRANGPCRWIASCSRSHGKLRRVCATRGLSRSMGPAEASVGKKEAG